MSIFDLFSGSDAQQAANVGTQYRLMGLQGATGQIQTGVTDASKYLDTASSILGGSKAYYDPLTPSANQAWLNYAKLVGAAPSAPGEVSGELASQPGFQYALDVAGQAADRAAAAGGMSNSGNALIAAQKAAQGVEAGNINQYASRLLALAGYAPNIAGAETGINATMAGVQGQQAALRAQQGQELAGLTTQAYTGAATDQENAILAQQQAAANVWNAIMGVAGLGIKATSAGGPFGAPKASASIPTTQSPG